MDVARPSDAGAVRKRRAYLAVSAATSVLMVFLFTTADPDPFERIVFPTIALAAAVLFVAVATHRLSLARTEVFLLVPPIVVLFGYLALWRINPTVIPDEVADIIPTMLWLGVVFPLAFLAFGTRRGLAVCVALYGVFVLLTVPPAVTGDITGGTSGVLGSAILHLTGLYAAMIALLGVLASRYEQLAVARSQAVAYAVQASADPLTGLANRRRLDDELDRQISLAQRHRHPLSAVIVDLDHFKLVNDEHGHDTGDRVLVEAALRLAATVREGDLVGRWGGEEFLVIAPHADHRAAIELAERCRARIAGSPYPVIGPLTASFGVATLAPDDDRRTLQRRADLALYTAKSDGRDRVVGIPHASDARDLDHPAETNGNQT